MQGEIAHVHVEGDHSVHAVLAPADCKDSFRELLQVVANFSQSFVLTLSFQARKSSMLAGASGMGSRAPLP
jgi:hypothetical protein